MKYFLISIDTKSATTLVHDLIVSHVDYCNTVLAWSHSVYYWQAECCSLIHHWHVEVWPWLVWSASLLYWLDVHQRVRYKLGVTIYRCLQNRVPQYLVDCCMRTSDVSSRQRLRSANQRQLVVPLHCCSKFRRQSFSVAALMVRNLFLNSLRDPTLSTDNFRSALKTHLLAAQWDM